MKLVCWFVGGEGGEGGEGGGNDPAGLPRPALSSHHIWCRSDLPCGEQLYDRGLQRLEAMLYAVDRFNSEKMLDKISFIYSWYFLGI